MNRYLVIGSKGFIGSNLVDRLSQDKKEVFGVDVVVDYEAGDSYYLVDASNADYRHIFESQTYDVCVNCSGAASVPDSLTSPFRDFSLNTVNVFKILESIRTIQPTCRFINLSSAAVYGNPTTLPISEDSLTAPISPYGYHKKASETICEEFHRYFGLRTCSLRIFSAYGEGLRKQLFWDLYKKACTQEHVTLFGTGDESRDFIYIDDLISAIRLAAEHSAYEADIVNVANGEEVFLRDCVSLFYGLFEKKIQYSFSGQPRSGDPDNWVADISRLSALGYRQSYSLKEGLERFYKWIRSIEKK